MRIIFQKFCEKVLYGFGFGLGMSLSWKVISTSREKNKKYSLDKQLDIEFLKKDFSLKNCNRSYWDLNPDYSDQNRMS